MEMMEIPCDGAHFPRRAHGEGVTIAGISSNGQSGLLPSDRK
jgi:hypothetical protein